MCISSPLDLYAMKNEKKKTTKMLCVLAIGNNAIEKTDIGAEIAQTDVGDLANRHRLFSFVSLCNNPSVSLSTIPLICFGQGNCRMPRGNCDVP